MAGVRLAALLGLLLLSACAHAPAPDAQVPPFAKAGYEPFSRGAAIAIAEREWRLFGQPVNDAPPGTTPSLGEDKPERLEGLWQRVGEYWWLGLKNGEKEQRWTGKHDETGAVFPPEVDGDYAWSAAFISYVMRIAGAGTRFPYSSSHADYIDAAAAGNARYAIAAENPATYAPQPGDLICLGRREATGIRFEDLPAGSFPSHCDIVVEQAADMLTVIGGNVDDAVTMKHVPVTPEGTIAEADGTPVDTRYGWFVVIRVLYDEE